MPTTEKKPHITETLLLHSHSGFVLASTASLDKALKRALLSRMRTLSRELHDRLFDGYGPLSSFAAKIDLAFALSLLDAQQYKRLGVIRKIRNLFAHSDNLLNFESPEVTKLFTLLRTEANDSKPPLNAFVAELAAVESHLKQHERNVTAGTDAS